MSSKLQINDKYTPKNHASLTLFKEFTIKIVQYLTYTNTKTIKIHQN